MRKSFVTICLCLLVVLALAITACAAPTTPADTTPAAADSGAPKNDEPAEEEAEEQLEKPTDETASEERLEVGFVYKQRNAYFDVMIEGAQAKADELGIDIVFASAEDHTDIDGQIAAVEDMITRQVDGIVLTPQDSIACVPVVVSAIEQGIPVVIVDNRLDKDTVAASGIDMPPFVGVSDYDNGYAGGKVVAEAMGGKGEVVIIEGLPSADNAEQRRAGAAAAFGEYPDIEIVDSQTAEWGAEKALNVITDILLAHPNVQGVFCANDEMAFGVIQGVEAANKTGEVFIAGIDGEATACRYIDEGVMTATIFPSQDLQGAGGVEALIKMINGETVEEEIMVSAVTITKNIAGDYY